MPSILALAYIQLFYWGRIHFNPDNCKGLELRMCFDGGLNLRVSTIYVLFVNT